MITLQPSLTRRHFLLSSLALLPAVRTFAQGTPVPSPDQDLLVALTLEAIPGKRLNTFFARYTFDAGGEAPAFARVGTALIMVESGAISLTSDDPVSLYRASEPGQPSQTEVPAAGIILEPGDGALVPNGSRMGLRNDGGEPATLLMLVAYAPYLEFSYVHPTELPGMTGITRRVIGFGAGAFEEAPAVMIIGREVVQPSGSAFSSTFGGIEIGAIESGSAMVSFRAGPNWMTPGVLDRADVPILPGETEVHAGDLVELGSSDGYVSTGSAITWRATGDRPLVILRGQIVAFP